jgi:xanthine dehydrogenase accessory factor
MISIWKESLRLFDDGQDFCVATIVSIEGSSPRHVGAKVLVRRDGSIAGTIGGGVFESEVINVAVEAIQKKVSTLKHFAFTGADTLSDKMICGGSVKVLIEYNSSLNKLRREICENLLRLDAERISGRVVTKIPQQLDVLERDALEVSLYDETGLLIGNLTDQSIITAELNSGTFAKPAELVNFDHMECKAFIEYFYPQGSVYIIGAGHVGVCVAHLASYVGFKVVLVDDRSEFANYVRVPEADSVIVVSSFDNCLAELNLGQHSYVVIVTRGHAHDRTVLEQILKTDAFYVGMIGSKRKIKMIFDALLKQGVAESQLKRVHSPIGLPIGGETPEEIAVSIVAELIQCRQDAAKRHKTSTCMSG